MNTHQDHPGESVPNENSPAFAVEPTLFMILMSEKGTDNIRKIYFLFRNAHVWSLELKGGSVAAIDHGPQSHKALLEHDKQNGLVEHIVLGEVPCLDNESVSKLFLTLWDKAVDDNDYEKNQWKELSNILYERGFNL